MDTCRILIDPEPQSGSWNMAVDEALLESAIADRVCTVRIYRWVEATVSLGYFQGTAAACSDPRLAGLPTVRRLSGGGAILHHHELTYSCTIPAAHPLAAEPVELYERVHEQIIAVLAASGIAAAMRGFGNSAADGASSSPAARKQPDCFRADEPFLCFGRGDRRDILVHGHKILGSAQRRRRGAVLQHGSLLIARSPHAPEFPGIADLLPGTKLPSSLADDLAVRIASILGGTAMWEPLSPPERARAAFLESDRYRLLAWGGLRLKSP